VAPGVLLVTISLKRICHISPFHPLLMALPARFHFPEEYTEAPRRVRRPASAPSRKFHCTSRPLSGSRSRTPSRSESESLDVGESLIKAATVGAAHGYLSPGLVAHRKRPPLHMPVGGGIMCPPSQSTRYPASGMPTMRAYEAAIYSPQPVNPHYVRRGNSQRAPGCLDVLEEAILFRSEGGRHQRLQGIREQILNVREAQRPPSRPSHKRIEKRVVVPPHAFAEASGQELYQGTSEVTRALLSQYSP